MQYSTPAPDPGEIEALEGITVLDFGTNWCGHCRAAAPLTNAVLQRHPQVRHIRVEDGKGRSLGRAYAVKLWPTLVFLRDGREVTRLVRPVDEAAIESAVAGL